MLDEAQEVHTVRIGLDPFKQLLKRRAASDMGSLNRELEITAKFIKDDEKALERALFAAVDVRDGGQHIL